MRRFIEIAVRGDVHIAKMDEERAAESSKNVNDYFTEFTFKLLKR